METPPPNQPPQDDPPVQPAPDPTPQPQPQPQPQPAYASTGPSIRFETIGQAFNMVFADAGTWIVSALMVIIPVIVLNIVLTMVMMGLLFGGAFFIAFLFRVISAAIVMGVAYAMIANMYSMAITALSGTKPSVNDMFKFGPHSMGAVLLGLVTGVGFGLCFIPGLIIGGLTLFAIPLMVDRKMAPMDAVNKSVEMVKKDAAMACLFFLVAMFCSGIVLGLTMAVMPLAVTMLYRDYFGFASAAPEPAATT